MAAVQSNTSSLPLYDMDIEPTYQIEEDSFLPKALSLTPFVGPFFSSFKHTSLYKKINNTRSTEQIIKLIQVKNDYVKCDIAYDVLLLTLSVSILAVQLIAGVGCSLISLTVLATCSLYYAAEDSSRLLHNLKVINDLQGQNKLFQPRFNRNFTVK